MQVTVTHQGKSFSADLNRPLDISIPLREGAGNVNAFHIPPVQIEPLRIGSFVGAVSEGGSCNVNNILFNPHGNGTHTECVGHIAKEKYTISHSLKRFFFVAELVTIEPELQADGDRVITLAQLEKAVHTSPEALVIRTLPNGEDKMSRQYSGTNPPYLHSSAARWMRERNVLHLLLDLPSVDREEDGGQLSSHHEFWNYPAGTRIDCTITELIYVPSAVQDGMYLLNLQAARFENDASPARPVLFELQEI
jgi:arylformamidase